MKIKIAILLILISTFIGCSDSDLPQNGSKWVLSKLNGKTIVTSNQPFFIINTKNNTISGNGGCNRFSASFNYENNNIEIKQLMSTKMACKDNNIENEFFNILKTTKRFKLKENTLFLYNSKNEIAVFKKDIKR